MNLLIIIGNAVVDYKFRTLLMDDPLGVAEKYGFRLSKFEVEMLQAALKKNTGLEQLFKDLENQLYTNIGMPPATAETKVLAMQLPNVPIPCTKKPCYWSLNVPPILQAPYDNVKAA